METGQDSSGLKGAVELCHLVSMREPGDMIPRDGCSCRLLIFISVSNPW